MLVDSGREVGVSPGVEIPSEPSNGLALNALDAKIEQYSCIKTKQPGLDQLKNSIWMIGGLVPH
jgi:hypothetical protein